MKKILFLFVVMLQTVGWACGCLFEPTIKQAYGWADVVFLGKAVKVQYVDEENSKVFMERRIIVTFTVQEYWKGQVGKTITLHTVYNQTSCTGYFFKEGKKFLVYSQKYPAKNWLNHNDRKMQLSEELIPKSDQFIFGTGLCTRTNYFSRARDDLRVLGKGHKPK